MRPRVSSRCRRRPTTAGRASSTVELNRGAVFHDVRGPLPSYPLHKGAFNRCEESERLRTTYTVHHGPKVVLHDRRSEIAARPSSLRLLAGTNEFAEDLTGQRMPLNASTWKSETQANFDGKVCRPRSAPVFRPISLMDNEEPVFATTARRRQADHEVALADANSHQCFAPSQYREGDMYSTTYGVVHRPFARDERMASAFWRTECAKRPWISQPAGHHSAEARAAVAAMEGCRKPVAAAVAKLHPSEAQLATLPHYTDPNVVCGRSEHQESYRNPFTAPRFYFEEPNKIERPTVPIHLQKTFVH